MLRCFDSYTGILKSLQPPKGKVKLQNINSLCRRGNEENELLFGAAENRRHL